MTTITQLRNIETSATIVINTEISKAAQLKEASTKGFVASVASYSNLTNGKTDMVKGWVIETVAPVKVVTSEVVGIEGFRTGKSGIMAINTESGRIVVTPTKQGFRAKLSVNKANNAEAISKTVGGKVKGHYIRFGQMLMSEINTLVASL